MPQAEPANSPAAPEDGLRGRAYANAVAPLCFVVAGPVHWPETFAVLIGAVFGGYFGAVLARRMPAAWLRAFVISFGAVMTMAFFWRAWN
jgi:uncharacterized membrane protein YfcA